MATYTPQPIDTSKIALHAELRELLERLARNNHDHWAQKRFGEGWRHGSMRNDDKKEHPDLVDYDDLPESEKDYDRKSVLETIKAVIALGYEIRRL
jgi:ryanodine receptor 2